MSRDVDIEEETRQRGNQPTNRKQKMTSLKDQHLDVCDGVCDGVCGDITEGKKITIGQMSKQNKDKFKAYLGLH